MPLEAGDGYISGLTITNPVGATDPKSQGDDHIRLIKAALKGTFPNLNGAVTPAPAELNILDGATLSTAELNILDGVTASAAELNILDGASLSTAELNILDGVTLTAAQINDAARLSQANEFTASQTISGTDKRLRYVDGAAPAGMQEWFMMNNNGVLQVWSATDATSAHELAIQITKNSSSEVTALALLGDSITLNGVSAADFARLSQSNIFAGASNVFANTSNSATTLLVAGSARGVRIGQTATINEVSGVDQTGSGSYQPLTVGGSTVALHISGTNKLEVNASGNFDFKGGTVTTNDANAQEVGFKGAPSADVSGSTNTSASSAGRTVRFTGGSGQTFTLDSDPPEDSVIVLDNNSGNSWTIAASGTLTWAATGGTGSRTLANNGMAVALHRGSGNWIINGGGLT